MQTGSTFQWYQFLYVCVPNGANGVVSCNSQWPFNWHYFTVAIAPQAFKFAVATSCLPARIRADFFSQYTAFMSGASAIILFDGVCNLCHGFVQFVIGRDKNQYFQFASLQSEVGQALLRQHGLQPAITPETVVLLEGGQALRIFFGRTAHYAAPKRRLAVVVHSSRAA